ncbi:MAG: flagella basal body P-ring formation protein FlgA [Deltaproteobacteria bacterium]|nr:MAG: flagella basal body P-ring formation protein FlgA [Deltaproteobacteria bacterium]
MMKNKFHIFICLFLLVFYLVANAHGVTVSFHSRAVVADEEVRLEQLADFDRNNEFTRALGSRIVARAGSPGQNISVSAAEIKNYLASRLALPPDLSWEGAETTQIYRDGILVNPQKIEQIIEEFLAENKEKLPKARINFKPKNLPLPFYLPKGELTWTVTPSNPGIIGSTGMNIMLRIDGKVKKNIMIRGELKALSRVAVALMPMSRGTAVNSEQIDMAVKNIANLHAPCFEKKQLVGKVLKVNIQANQPIELTDIDSPPVIKKGDLVKIILNSGGLHITASGIAKTDGKLNEVIRVRNTTSNKIIHCVVAGPGLAEVRI